MGTLCSALFLQYPLCSCALVMREDPKVKDTHKEDSVLPKTQESVFYVKEGKKKPKAEPSVQSGADCDVFKAQTPNQETRSSRSQGGPRRACGGACGRELEVPGAESQEQHRTAHSPGGLASESLFAQILSAAVAGSLISPINSPNSFSDFFLYDWQLPQLFSPILFVSIANMSASLKNLSKNKKVVPFPGNDPSAHDMARFSYRQHGAFTQHSVLALRSSQISQRCLIGGGQPAQRFKGLRFTAGNANGVYAAEYSSSSSSEICQSASRFRTAGLISQQLCIVDLRTCIMVGLFEAVSYCVEWSLYC
ncbi:hypothetical protein E5288_WYG012752 [Bos mutus]|uniref:Uncharacterized protein n=1 Tax=Bos mutus TaxID=72004 RepID=A0A6B0QV53_9CETA|nr:hypothetical protein [Bos mutus]